MTEFRLILILAFLVLALVVVAILYQAMTLTPVPTPTVGPSDPISFYAAATFTRLTVIASSYTPTYTSTATPVPTATGTPAPTETLTQTGPEPTGTDTATATPSMTPFPTATPPTRLPNTVTPSPTTPISLPENPVPCNRASLVQDVSYPDGAVVEPGMEFTKIWRLRNTGTCTWTDHYAVIFAGGDRMSAPRSAPLPKVVPPDSTVDVALEMTAPTEPGTYRGQWELNDGSESFGLGEAADKVFWVEIEVPDTSVQDSGTLYNFAIHYCSADWKTSTAEINCGGPENDRTGFVMYLSRPELEHRTEDEPALWTQPPDQDDGWIRGAYPPLQIESGDRFVADIGCLANSRRCDVTFQLNYHTGGSSSQRFGQWHETFDRKVTHLDLDLSELAGQKVEFVLTVLTNGDPAGDAPFWLMPRIERD